MLKWLRKSVFERHRHVKSQIKSSLKSASAAGKNLGDEDDDNDGDDSEYETAFRNTEAATNSLENIGSDDLEPMHESAMLLGALTLLSQLMTIRPNLRLKSYALTRTEIVYILAVGDKTFSQVEENLPDTCSLSAAKKLISPVLNAVSDYLQPTLDMSISNFKQGRYKPKETIWLKE